MAGDEEFLRRSSAPAYARVPRVKSGADGRTASTPGTPHEKADDPELGTATIDQRRYTSAAFMRLEWERLWTKVWLVAGRSLDIPAAGDYIATEIGPESILVVRQAVFGPALTLQSGVTTVGEGASGFNVRGGNIDQNLVLLDGAPLFNTSHLLGFYSVISTDAVQNFTLYKGTIPACAGPGRGLGGGEPGLGRAAPDVADGQGQGVGGVGRAGRIGQPQQPRHHRRDLLLVGPAVAGHRRLDLARGVQRDR